MRREVVSIQYLRGIAAMMVVFAHANAQFLSPTHLLLRNIGWSGVDLFFVISGFVMTYIIAAKPMTAGDFLRRRIVRIAPLYWLMTGVTAALIVSLPALFTHSRFTWLEFATSLLFIPFRNSGSGEIAPILKLGWTLNYEMFFYLCFGALILLRPWRRTVALCCIFGTFVIVERLAASQNLTMLEFYGSAITFEFLFGCVVGCLYISGYVSRLQIPAATMLTVVGLVALIVGSLTPDLGHRELERGIPAAITVIGVLAIEQRVTLASKWLHVLGDATYSIYLTHLYVVMALFHFVRDVPVNGLISYVLPLLAVVVCAGFGTLIYTFAEQRLIAVAKHTFVPRSAGLAA
jgi:peptidoglycan/LPS O-acetylase OafA/YrhL